MAGDVVLWCQDHTLQVYVAVVLYDGERPESIGERWRARTIAEATPFAREWARQTHGRIWAWDGTTVTRSLI